MCVTTPHSQVCNSCYTKILYFVIVQIVVDAVLAIQQLDTPIDLHMVEIMEMKHKTELDTR